MEEPSPGQAGYEAALAEAENRDFGTSEEDLEAYGIAAGTAGGAAACTAVGAAAAAPLCGWIGGEIGGWIASTLFGGSDESEKLRRQQAAQWDAWDKTRVAFVDAWYLFVADTIGALSVALERPVTVSELTKIKATWGGASEPSVFQRLSEWPWPSDMPVPGTPNATFNWEEWQQVLADWVAHPLYTAVQVPGSSSIDASKIASGAWKSGVEPAQERFKRAAAEFRGAFGLATSSLVAEHAAERAPEEANKPMITSAMLRFARSLAPAVPPSVRAWRPVVPVSERSWAKAAVAPAAAGGAVLTFWGLAKLLARLGL